MKGKRAKPTPYPDGQNVIRDADSGAMIYLPPEAKDVPLLMNALIAWINKTSKEGMPPPIIAALAHYQFVTIHPYYDGNGRTARLMATFILHRDGYSLKGFFSLEEHHAIDLDGYYRSLATHSHHNYYEGRAEADLTGWLEYFTSILATVFLTVREEAESYARKDRPPEPEALRHLDRRARIVLSFFAKTDSITSGEVAKALGLSDRMARTLLKTWVNDGWLVITGASNKSRRYILSEVYRKFIGNGST
jgi:Fic family protein